ncbi:MAG: DUF3488 domain-containing protein [Bdellovibrionaceae bacterium]|nr:DUF3488 domain-containing protein [Pseudobdellovibrionaceae bacterium]
MKHVKLYFFFILFCILPHTLFLPWDCTFIFAGFSAWVAISMFQKQFIPHPLLKRSVILLIPVYFLYRFSTLADPDAASALLCSVAILKIFEVYSYRDAMITLLMSLLIVMFFLIHSYSLYAAIYMFATFIVFIYLLMDLQRKKYRLSQSFLKLRELFSYEMLIALPLLVSLFIFFPRFSTSFGSGEKIISNIGFTDRIDLGQMMSLAQSDRTAFKVQFLRGRPSSMENLYFRGAVLTINQNLSWKKVDQSKQLYSFPERDAPKNYRILLFPQQKKSLFLLDNSIITEISPNHLLFFNKDESTFSLGDVPDDLLQYYATIQKKQDFLPPSQWDEQVNIPPPSKELKTLLVTLKNKNPRDTIENVLNYFRSHNFSYSTQAPEYKSIDDFLFHNAGGYCEHYASVFTILLRLMKIPSRVVAGYLGAESNPYDDTFVVRDRYAHAWTEVYIDGEGWIRVDPTAIIYPQRLQAFRQIPSSSLPLLGSLFSDSALFFDSLNNRFELFMLNFNQDSQYSTVSRIVQFLNLKNIKTIVVFFLLLILIAILFIFLWKSEKMNRDKTTQAYHIALKKLKSKGILKYPNEGPKEFQNRLKTLDKNLQPYIEFIDAYILCRFANRPIQDELYKKARKLS